MVRQGEKAPVDRIRAFQRATQANRRCADCVERGPTYVCLDFRTFVCQTCSGIHREFGHKIKGISLSDWSPAEVAALEAGGNERAARKWLGRLDRESHPEPDSSDLEALREFLKLKYTEKRWLVEEPAEAQPEAKPPEAEPQAAPAPQQEPAAPGASVAVGDLLSDYGSCPAVAVTPPPLGCPSYSANVGANAAVAPQSDDCGAQWTADFGSVSDKILPGPGANAEGLIDLDFCCSVDPSACKQGADTAADACGANSPKASLAKPQDIEAVAAAKSPVAEPAEEPAPTAPSPPGGIKAVEGREPTIGDQLREAVLHGSTDDLMRLYRQASEPPARPAPPAVDRERVAAFAAFDELGSWASPESGPRPSPPLTPPGGPLAPGPALPPMPPLPGAAQPSAPSSLTPQQLAHLMPQQCGMLTPLQVDQMSPQELVQMQLMIQSALQARTQAAAAPPPRPACGDGAAVQQQAAEKEESLSQPKEFGDLLVAFTEKHPIPGLSLQA